MTHKELLLEPALKKWYQYKADRKSIVFEKISNELVNKALNIFYRSGEVITDTIRKEFNIAATLQKIHIDQLPYNKLFAKNVIEFHADITTEYSWLIPRNLMSILLSRGLGTTNSEMLSKDVTQLEEAMMHSILEIITRSSHVFWLGALDLPSEYNITTDLKESKKIHKDELIIQVSMIIELGEYGMFPIAFYATNNNFKKFLEKHSELEKDKKQITVNLAGTSVSDIFVPVEVYLGTTDVPMNDILGLQIGDVFQLDQKVGSPVTVKVGQEAEFISFLGRKDTELVVRIEDLKGNIDPSKIKSPPKNKKPGLAETIPKKENQTIPPLDLNDDISFDSDNGGDIGDDLIEKIEATNPTAEDKDDDFHWDIDDL